MEKVNRQIREMRRARPAVTVNEKVVDLDAGSLSFVREKNLRYRIEVEILPKLGILRVADEYLTALTAEGKPTGKRKPFLESVESGSIYAWKGSPPDILRTRSRSQYPFTSALPSALSPPGCHAPGTGKLVLLLL